MSNKTLLLRVTGSTDCALLRPGDRWHVSNAEIQGVDGAKLCLHAIHQLHDQLVDLTQSTASDPLVLHCEHTHCRASFLAKPITSVSQQDSKGTTRRLETVALRAGEKLRSAGTFMSCLSSEMALEIAAVAGRREGAAGTEFLPAGIRGERLYIVADGTVEVVRPSTKSHAETILAVLGPGDCFGEMSLLTNQPTSASVRARTECKLLTLTRPQLERLLNDSPELARVFSQLLAERLSTLNQTLEGEMERGMRGQLATLPFAELVQLLHASRRTGTLLLSGKGRNARLGFQNGQLAFAESDTARGEEVFYDLVRWNDGDFRLDQEADTFPEDARIQTDTLAMLMEAVRRMDEDRSGN